MPVPSIDQLHRWKGCKPQIQRIAGPRQQLRAEALRQSLPRLSPEHREVIDLAYYHGKSVKEIAEIVGISEATVKTRMFYARRKLAELVETT